ncbi:MAG: DUF4870 domain-containing protein [bacterium]|nr:DUF4870 domain-containing protein [bacterium]
MSGGKTALGLDANVGALICYLGNLVCMLGLIYSIIVVVSDKANRLTRFHAFQSIFLTVTLLVIMIPLYIVMFVGVFVDAAIGLPLVTGLLGLLMGVVSIGALVFTILAAIKGYGGEFYKIPVVGGFAEKYAG